MRPDAYPVLLAAVTAAVAGCGDMCLTGTRVPERPFVSRIPLSAAKAKDQPEACKVCGKYKDATCAIVRDAQLPTSGPVLECKLSTHGEAVARYRQTPPIAVGSIPPEGWKVSESQCDWCHRLFTGEITSCRLFPSLPEGAEADPWSAECAGTIAGHCYDGGKKLGRGTEGQPRLEPPRSPRGFFARMAMLEAASVFAFERLACELEHLGAPRLLVTRARRAAQQEACHARVARRLARLPATRVLRRTITLATPRTAFAIACENVNEGIVGETLGAAFVLAMAARQKNARDRAALASIGRDELHHAALAVDVHHFLLDVLGDDEQRAVHLGLERALAAARAQPHDVSPDVARAVGLPDERDVRSIVRGLGPQLRGLSRRRSR